MAVLLKTYAQILNKFQIKIRFNSKFKERKNLDKENEIVYFELNNWFAGEHYPNDEPFLTWFQDDSHIVFCDADWVKKNNLCVVYSFVDMSENFCITATKKWVEENCPGLITKHKEFIRYPDANGHVYGQFGHEFLEYKEDTIGIKEDND